jgi:hypothetical protein
MYETPVAGQFDYIEIFRSGSRSTRNGMLSPVNFERQQNLRTK